MRAAGDRGLINKGLDEAAAFERSPTAAGFIAGLKAALIGGPIGAGAFALKGGNPAMGALLGALIPGLVTGLSTASTQKLENLNTEAYMRYHAQNIKDREPMFFMPPRRYMAKYFTSRGG